MKANVTLKLDSDLLREIRILAAEEGTSISALVAGQLAELVRRRREYDRARRRALERLRRGFALGWKAAKSRDSIHER